MSTYQNKKYLCESEFERSRMEQLENLKQMINQGEVDQAIEILDRLLSDDDHAEMKDILFYLRGNAYRKKADWRQALNNYQQAIEINPQSPAAQARRMVMDILNFYHKDMYNQ